MIIGCFLYWDHKKGRNVALDSFKCFINNLNKISLGAECKNNYFLSELLGVNCNTLRGWMANNRCPKLSTLDSIADKLGIGTADLLNPNFCFEVLKGKKQNNSVYYFRKNLQEVFIANNKTTWQERESLLFAFISVDSLKSFFKKSNYRSPSLKQLDSIASALGINPYKLISEEFLYEKDQ